MRGALRKHHPTGRFNNGQKLAAYVFILTTPALVLTGLVLMFRDVFPEELVLLSRMIPVWSFAIVGIALLVHIYIGMLDVNRPGVEANAAFHAGLQRHPEVSAALLIRWHRFPWDRYVNTTVAFGLGPSYAFRTPRVEEHPRRPASRLLVFMPVEITFAPPQDRDPSWELLLRVHHRSGAFRLVSDARGSNFVSTGVRYRFSDTPDLH